VVAHHPYFRGAHAYGGGYSVAHVVRELMGNVDRESLTIEFGYGHSGFHVGLILTTCFEPILHDGRCPSKRFVDTFRIRTGLRNNIS